MKISKDKWVAIHYTLTDEDGNIIDSSAGGEPLGYVHGNGYLIPGLERELESKTVGDKFIAVIKPEDGYGEFDPNLIIDVDRSQFDFAGELQLGMQFQVGTPKGLSIVKIKEINGDKIKIDGNFDKVLESNGYILEGDGSFTLPVKGLKTVADKFEDA